MGDRGCRALDRRALLAYLAVRDGDEPGGADPSPGPRLAPAINRTRRSGSRCHDDSNSACRSAGRRARSGSRQGRPGNRGRRDLGSPRPGADPPAGGLAIPRLHLRAGRDARPKWRRPCAMPTRGSASTSPTRPGDHQRHDPHRDRPEPSTLPFAHLVTGGDSPHRFGSGWRPRLQRQGGRRLPLLAGSRHPDVRDRAS